MTKRVLLGLAIAFLLSTPAQAQPLVTISCTSVVVDFRTSIQPDSASVQIQSNAGTETHSVTLVQGGTDVVSFPLDGQSGETVSVTVTLVYKGNPNVTSATQTLADCPVPSPSPTPSPTVEPSPEPSPSPLPPTETPAAPGASIEPSPEPSPIEEEVESVVAETGETAPGELPRTGIDNLALLALGADLLLAGFLLRRRASRVGRHQA